MYVAMDRDHDLLNGKLFNIKGVVYTYGYSWENDVWQPEVIVDVFNTLYTKGTPSHPDIQQLLEIFEKFIEEISTAVCADAYLSEQGISFIPRDKHISCLNIHRNRPPGVNLDKINDLIIKHKIKIKSVKEFGKKKGLDTLSDCYGHLVADFCYHLITHFLKKLSNVHSLIKDVVYSVGIEKYLQNITSNKLSTIQNHYKLLFSRI